MRGDKNLCKDPSGVALWMVGVAKEMSFPTSLRTRFGLAETETPLIPEAIEVIHLETSTITILLSP